MALLPAFGEQMVPVRVRLALTIALTMVIYPLVAPEILKTWSNETHFFRFGIVEVFIGLCVGLALRLLVMALQIAGTVAGQSTSLAQLFGGVAVDPQPAIGFVLVLGGLAVATAFGLHVKIAIMLVETYDLFPSASELFATDFAEWVVALVTFVFRLAVILAAPFLLASGIYNLTLGVINRAMPQLMVAFVGAPAITFGALLILALTAPLILTVWFDALDRTIADPFEGR